MSLPIQRVDDFVEAHKITDQGQVLAIACLVRECECAGNDAADFGDVPLDSGALVKIRVEGIPRAAAMLMSEPSSRNSSGSERFAPDR